MILNIAKEFSPVPAGRYLADGPFSAERFRDTLLIPKLQDAIKTGQVLVVQLDGLLAISSSFLEEAFGGLVRSGKFSIDEINQHFRIVTSSRTYEWARLDAEKYLKEAATRH